MLLYDFLSLSLRLLRTTSFHILRIVSLVGCVGSEHTSTHTAHTFAVLRFTRTLLQLLWKKNEKQKNKKTRIYGYRIASVGILVRCGRFRRPNNKKKQIKRHFEFAVSRAAFMFTMKIESQFCLISRHNWIAFAEFIEFRSFVRFFFHSAFVRYFGVFSSVFGSFFFLLVCKVI